MILVKRTATELSAGVAEMESFRKRLKTEWEPRLLRLYLKKRVAYRKAIREYQNKPWYQRLLLPRPARPKVPRYSTLYDQYYWPVWRQWQTALQSKPEIEIPIPNDDKDEVKFGKQGEQYMLRWLAARLDDRYLASCRLYMADLKKADIDVIVVGPKGYWYFEVKNWKGEIIGEGENKWTQIPNYGEPKSHASPVRTWKLVAGEISRVLQPMWQDPLVQPSLMKLGGGIAFLLEPPECRLSIKRRTTVKYGHLSSYWWPHLKNAPTIQAATPQLIYKIMETLLTKSQSVEQNRNKFSAALLAKKLIRDAENKLKKQAY